MASKRKAGFKVERKSFDGSWVRSKNCPLQYPTRESARRAIKKYGGKLIKYRVSALTAREKG